MEQTDFIQLLKHAKIASISVLISLLAWTILGIMLVAAIITPPDLMTLVLVTIPLYLLYEVSILVTRNVNTNVSSIMSD